LRKLMESIEQVDPGTQLRVGQEDFFHLLSTIQEEAEQLAVYSSTVATAALLRKHKSSPQNLQRNDQMLCLENHIPPTSSSSPNRDPALRNTSLSLLSAPKSVFEELDSNQQGDVSEEEFVEVLFQKPQLLRTLNAPLPRSESEREKVYRRLFNSMNRSQSGYLTYEEVESYVSDQQQQQQQQQQPQLQLGQGQGQGQGQVKMQEQGQRQQQQQQSQSGRGRERGREQNQTMSLSRRQPDSQVSPNSSPQRNRSRGRYDEQSQEAEVEVEAELHELEQELEHRGQGQGRGQGRGRQNDRGSSRASPDKFLQLGRIPSGELDENVFVEDDSNSESDESPSRPRAESRGSRETSLQMRSSEPPVPSYADMFKLIDRNSDGKLSLMEFMQALRRHPTLAEVSFFVSPFLAWAILLFCSSLPCFVLILS
jgi:Ca2+-binding EF-hand superfamily protein